MWPRYVKDDQRDILQAIFWLVFKSARLIYIPFNYLHSVLVKICHTDTCIIYDVYSSIPNRTCILSSLPLQNFMKGFVIYILFWHDWNQIELSKGVHITLRIVKRPRLPFQHSGELGTELDLRTTYPISMCFIKSSKRLLKLAIIA